MWEAEGREQEGQDKEERWEKDRRGELKGEKRIDGIGKKKKVKCVKVQGWLRARGGRKGGGWRYEAKTKGHAQAKGF